MTKEYSNEEFGFGSSAYAEPVVKREEDKIAKSSSNSAKITQAAVTAVAPPVEAAAVQAPVAVAPPLPPLPTASAGAPPAIENPAESADFWGNALKMAGIPVGVGLASMAGGYLLGKGKPPFDGGGGPPPPPPPPPPSGPPPLSPLEEARLNTERARAEAIQARTAMEERKVALSEERARTDDATKAAAEAQRAEAKKQKTTSSGGVNPQDRQMLNSSENAKIDKAVIADQKAVAPKPMPQATPQPEAQWSTPEEVAAQQAQKIAEPKAIAEPIKNTNVAVASMLPPETPPTTVAPVSDAVIPVVESKAPAVPNAEVAAAAEKTLKTRRTSEEVAADKENKPYISAKKTILSYLGAKEGPEMEAKAKAALSILKEKAYGGEKVKQTDSHINEQWAKGKAYILAHPEEFDKEIVERQKKSGEQLKSEASAKKNAKVDSQRGGINVDAIAEAGGKVAGAVKPVLGQAGALVGSELKGAAAMLPFMLATDVGAQNTGYRRELEQQLKTERNASRAAELQSEIQKLDEDKYIKAMKRRYVDKNIPAQLRPQ